MMVDLLEERVLPNMTDEQKRAVRAEYDNMSARMSAEWDRQSELHANPPAGYAEFVRAYFPQAYPAQLPEPEIQPDFDNMEAPAAPPAAGATGPRVTYPGAPTPALPSSQPTAAVAPARQPMAPAAPVREPREMSGVRIGAIQPPQEPTSAPPDTSIQAAQRQAPNVSLEQRQQQANAALQEADKQKQRMQFWANSGVDDRHALVKQEVLFAHAEWKAAYMRSCEVIDENGTLVLLGDRGNGKTQMGAQLIRRACANLQMAKYMRGREIGMSLRRAYNPKSKITELEAVNQLVMPHLLVIDEAQERPDKDWEIRTLSLIFDKRYAAMRPTVIIANCTLKQFEDLMGGSVVDRIREGGCVLKFDWPSFRGVE